MAPIDSTHPKSWQNLSSGQMQSLRFRCQSRLASLQKLLRRGGLRLKLISFITLIILLTVGVLNYFIIGLLERTISEKAFEVAESSLTRMGEVSQIALLERTYESKVNLDEILADIRSSQLKGVLDIDIYATVKKDDQYDFAYFAGFSPDEKKEYLADGEMTAQIFAARDDTILRQEYLYRSQDKQIPAYLFVKPIFTEYQHKSHLLGAVAIAYSQEAILSATDEVIQGSILITLAILSLSILAIYLLGARFTRPIITVAEAAGEVTKGNLDVKLDITTRDELEDLAQQFNIMVEGLKRKEMMQKYISCSTVSMIEKGSGVCRLGGEHETLTLLFSDIRGFTAICEGKKPQEVVQIVNFYLNLQADIIQKWGGDIDKFVGDEVMASFCGPGSIDQAINAAIEIQKTIGSQNRLRKKEGIVTVEVGIGINHGEVVVGNIGSYDRMDWTAMGSVVNLAAKYCSRALPSEILIDKQTYQKTRRTHPIALLSKKERLSRGLAKLPEVLIIKL